MSQHRTAEVSEAEIAVHWPEEDYVNPPEKFVAQANLTDKTVFVAQSHQTGLHVFRLKPGAEELVVYRRRPEIPEDRGLHRQIPC